MLSKVIVRTYSPIHFVGASLKSLEQGSRLLRFRRRWTLPMRGCCTTCNGWYKQVSYIWRKREQTPRNGVVCQRQVRFAFESLVRANEQVAEAMPTDVVSQFNQAFREATEGLYGSTFQHVQSITTARGYLKNRQPNLVADYWRL